MGQAKGVGSYAESPKAYDEVSKKAKELQDLPARLQISQIVIG